MRESATITMSRPVLDQLREVARREKRSLSQQIELLVEQVLAERDRQVTKRKGGAK
jgi:hypothetical protein